jgi:hypothetical protein
VARLEDERKALYREIEHLRDRAAELELTRRTAEAKGISYQSRAAQLQDDLRLSAQRETELATAVAAEQADKRGAVELLQARLAEAEANVEHERSVSMELAAKLASAEEMLTNVIAINEYLVRQGSEHAYRDAKAASSVASTAKKKSSNNARGLPHYMMGTNISKAKRSTSGKAPSSYSSSPTASSGRARKASQRGGKSKLSSKTTKVQLEKANESKVRAVLRLSFRPNR